MYVILLVTYGTAQSLRPSGQIVNRNEINYLTALFPLRPPLFQVVVSVLTLSPERCRFKLANRVL